MIRGVVRQLCHVFSSATPVQTVPLVTNNLCCASFYTSTKQQSKAKGWERESVRQRGTEVTPSITDSQQVVFDAETKKSFIGGVEFPTADTLNQSFDGVPFNQIPIIHIKATSNNTIVSVTEADGNVLAIQSSGTVGFRNAHKATNVAAQAAAIALAEDALKKEIKQVRVCIKGIGPGRLPALTAIDMSGIKVVSITDTTPLPDNGNRPKKVRRL